jgi:uncharacterized membrane protein
MSVTTETATTATTTAAATVAKLAPPVTVAGFTLNGISLQDWVLYLTVIYTLLMIAHKVWSMGVDWQWWGKNTKRKVSRK